MEREKISVRPACGADLEEIVKIYDHARHFMWANGNPTQWAEHHPGAESARQDLEAGILYVAESGGEVVGTFVLMEGPDPTYGLIEDGCWRWDSPYGAVHRVASRGSGVFRAALEFAKSRYSHIRIDTHRDNAPMRHLITKAGFSHRGTIYAEDGTPRLAYDFMTEDRHGKSE